MRISRSQLIVFDVSIILINDVIDNWVDSNTVFFNVMQGFILIQNQFKWLVLVCLLVELSNHYKCTDIDKYRKKVTKYNYNYLIKKVFFLSRLHYLRMYLSSWVIKYQVKVFGVNTFLLKKFVINYLSKYFYNYS